MTLTLAFSKALMRYYVSKCDNSGTTDGSDIEWDVCDRARNCASVSTHRTRAEARDEARKRNAEWRRLNVCRRKS